MYFAKTKHGKNNKNAKAIVQFFTETNLLLNIYAKIKKKLQNGKGLF
jgi:hypothetical protein